MEAKTKRADSTDRAVRRLYTPKRSRGARRACVADLQGAAAAHLAFGKVFSAGKAKIRVYNPVREQHGWASTHTVLEIVNDDMPFLVDSVTMEVNRQGLTLHLVIHPVLRVVRDGMGELTSVRPAPPGSSPEDGSNRSAPRGRPPTDPRSSPTRGRDREGRPTCGLGRGMEADAARCDICAAANRRAARAAASSRRGAHSSLAAPENSPLGCREYDRHARGEDVRHR